MADLANLGPKSIKGPEQLDAVGQIVIGAAALVKKIDSARTVEKDPFLRGGQEVDAWFKPYAERMKRIKDAFTALASDYQRKVAAEARAKAEADAKRAREEEQRRLEAQRKAEEEGRNRHAEQHAGAAEKAAIAAEQAEAVAAAAPKDLVRTTTASGLVAGGRNDWVSEIFDYDAIPLDKLRPYFKRDAIEAAIRLAVKQGVREIGGVRIFEEVKATFR